ncbi:Soluble guanylate cyclase 88E [Tetrabaena socialis]|uniref:Soluble guanylate cyclase 88E n=1 Tax=Tetrabaena socialis TaxID=47790 RepID=A0A2J8A274_9CHLO|nr:Soluble guanylate cyclase 88E [Tetrabaena socialis]|eukprot:PNH06636.1 Soluble guanylate cyclase 88E [Tetrabaena socialis]
MDRVLSIALPSEVHGSMSSGGGTAVIAEQAASSGGLNSAVADGPAALTSQELLGAAAAVEFGEMNRASLSQHRVTVCQDGPEDSENSGDGGDCRSGGAGMESDRGLAGDRLLPAVQCGPAAHADHRASTSASASASLSFETGTAAAAGTSPTDEARVSAAAISASAACGPAFPTSLPPPVLTGLGSSEAAGGIFSSPGPCDPAAIGIDLSHEPPAELLGTITLADHQQRWLSTIMSSCEAGQQHASVGGLELLPPPLLLALAMPSVGGESSLRIAPKSKSLDLHSRLFATGAAASAAGKMPSAGRPVLQMASASEEVQKHETLVERWHEVALVRFDHPQLQRRVILVTQSDVSPRIWAERQLARVVEAEHTLLENIFPHHVIEHIAATAAIDLDERGTPQLQQQQQNGAVTGAAHREADDGVPDNAWLPAIRGETFLHLATSHTAITILFCDIQGFTPLCSQMQPVVVMSFLNDLFTRLDGLLDEYGVYKVETIGDCYVVAGGLMREDEETGAVTVRSDDVDPQHAYRTIQFAKALLRAASRVSLPTTGLPVQMRVGIHSGAAMSGVVGTRMPRFCLFGDTMNVASRMESTGEAGAIHVSQATRDLVPHEAWECRGGMEVKGKGVMETYLLRA